jgi:CO/xanthine dehydrogenase Mo-binding subunit
VPDTGTGSLTILQQIVAEELQVPLESVTVVSGDTDTATLDAGAGGSRVTHGAGQATLAASRAVKQALIELSERILGTESGSVQLRNGAFEADGGKSITMTALMARAVELEEAPISRIGEYTPPGAPDVTSFVAQVAEVEVDRETGQVRLRRFVTAHDVGTIINPLTHQGQIEGGFVQGMGQALIEQLSDREGDMTALNLGDYKLPTMADIPELTTVLLESKAGPTPYEGKSIGESSNVAPPAAIANAVYDAVGVRITDLPITAEKVYNALRAKERGE